MPESKASLKNIYSAIAGAVNIEQSLAYPPSVFSSQYNTVTSLLLSKLADIFPDDQSVIDIIDPYVVRKIIPVRNGYIQLPTDKDYRNMLGSPLIAAKPDSCSECFSGKDLSVEEFNDKVVKSGCRKVEVVILSQSEFGYRTQSKYKAPTIDKPIGVFSGSGQIKICPVEVTHVEVMFLEKEETYVYGYDLQPDDTFVYNKNKSTESKWTSAAFEPIFKAMLALYSAYSRDNSLRDWSQIISQQGLI